MYRISCCSVLWGVGFLERTVLGLLDVELLEEDDNGIEKDNGKDVHAPTEQGEQDTRNDEYPDEEALVTKEVLE